MSTPEPPGMSENRRKMLLGVCIAVLVASTILEVAVHNHHLDDPNWKTYWFNFPFFYGIAGGLGCLILTVVAKGLGKLFISQPEDYYDSPARESRPPHQHEDGGQHG